MRADGSVVVSRAKSPKRFADVDVRLSSNDDAIVVDGTIDDAIVEDGVDGVVVVVVVISGFLRKYNFDNRFGDCEERPFSDFR